MDEDSKKEGIGLWVGFGLLGLAIVVLTLSWDRMWGDDKSPYEVLSALFGGLAFAGVIFAILLQKRELELQRKELALTRDELRRSASAQEQLNDANERPMVKVQLLPGRHGNWRIIIENVGRSAAENLSLSTSADMICDGYDGTFLGELPIFAGVGFTLTSGQSIVYEIPDFFEPEGGAPFAQPSEFKMSARYCRGQKMYEDQYLLNKDLAKCTTAESGNNAGQIPEKLDRIAEILRDLRHSMGSRGFGGL
ncbi:MAG: hypothetical protein OMOMHJEC_03338 [Xanthomonadales bacterium]|nr:hypothetical protein [Xanthomonadales bacterium]